MKVPALGCIIRFMNYRSSMICYNSTGQSWAHLSDFLPPFSTVLPSGHQTWR